MLDGIEIEKQLTGSFKRIIRRMPKKMQDDKSILKIVAAYLKIGGEKLARQSVETFKVTDRLETNRRKRNLRDEALIRALEIRKIKEINENENISDNELNIIL